jgi:hypothetical protein
MPLIGDYNAIMSDRNLFNSVVYTPLSEALRILEERQNDSVLIAKIDKLLNGDVPEVFKKHLKCAVQFRQIATPNNDCLNFLNITKDFGLTPIFMEYHSDKFSSNNSFKRSLGQLHIQGPVNKQDEFRIEKISIMDFNKHNGKILKNVTTHWNEPLIDFHRRLFNICKLEDQACNFYDTSEWVSDHGSTPEEYYKQFFLLFICFGILFENFTTEEDEGGDFSKNVILPAINEVFKLTGVKPLIVPIPPMDMENDNYWILYNDIIKSALIKN